MARRGEVARMPIREAPSRRLADADGGASGPSPSDSFLYARHADADTMQAARRLMSWAPSTRISLTASRRPCMVSIDDAAPLACITGS